MILKCLVVDDEEIAGKGLERYCREISFIRVDGICSSTQEAMDILEKDQVDLLFLDIQMPRQTGLEFLRSLTSPPMTIITTAFPDFALDGFELDVIDYLVKPFSFERFLKACHKAREFHELKRQTQALSHENYFFIKADHRIEKIETKDILFIEALENYICIYTEKRKYMTLVSLKQMEEILPSQLFTRVQKSFIVAKNKVQSVDGNMVCLGNYKVPISKKWRTEVLNDIFSNRFLKR